MENHKVFMSVGSNGTVVQRAATDQIFSVIQTSGLAPRQMDRNEWSAEQPLRAIRRVMEECHGAVIVAFTRHEFSSGIEYKKNNEVAQVEQVKLPTVWNQIEAALAYGQSIPLLVICEHGLRDEGLLEGKYDWRVFWTDFSQTDIGSERFSGFVRSWKHLVLEHAAAASRMSQGEDTDLAKLPISKLLRMLTAPQIWFIFVALAATLATVVTTAYKIGAGKWP